MNNPEVMHDSNKPVALITGATGFVGSHLVRRLVRDEWQVHIVSRVGSRLPDAPEFSQILAHPHDGTTESMLKLVGEAKPDVVFHLASLILSQHTHKDVEPLILSNVLLGSQLLEAMKANGICRIINTGTFWQHYNNDDYNPVCLYAATKQAFEAILEYYVQVCAIKAITLKLFDTYGPEDLRPKLFNLLSKAAITGESLNMTAGEQLIDLVHIEDVIEAFIIASNRLLKVDMQEHERYAISSGHPMRLQDVVEKFLEITEQPISINWGAKLYRDREVMTPWDRGTWIQGWSPKIKLEEGFTRLAALNKIC